MAPPTNKKLAQDLRKIAGSANNDKVKHVLMLAADRLEKPGHKQTQNRAAVLYSVWDNRTDQCIAFELPGKECAEQMGIEYNSFMIAIARGSDRWTIEKRFADEKI